MYGNPPVYIHENGIIVNYSFEMIVQIWQLRIIFVLALSIIVNCSEWKLSGLRTVRNGSMSEELNDAARVRYMQGFIGSVLEALRYISKFYASVSS